MAARTARLEEGSAFFMTAFGRMSGPAPGPLERVGRTAPGRTVRQPGRPGEDRCHEEGRPRCSVPTLASASEGNCAPRRCRNVSQLHTPPGDIHPRYRGQQAQRWRGRVRSWPGHGSVAGGRMLPGFGFFQPSWGARAAQTVRRWRPLSRRDFKMARPARVDMRLRKPCVLARLRVFGW